MLFIYILVVLSAVYLHFTYKVFCQLFIYIFKFSSAVCLHIPVVYLQFIALCLHLTTVLGLGAKIQIYQLT